MLFLSLIKHLSLIRNFKGRKSTALGKFLLEKIFFYWLGHLQAKNQRFGKQVFKTFLLNAVLSLVLHPVLRGCPKTFSMIRNFKGVKFNRFTKKLKYFCKETDTCLFSKCLWSGIDILLWGYGPCC